MSIKGNHRASQPRHYFPDPHISSSGHKVQHRPNGKENHCTSAPPLTPLGNGDNTPKRDLFRTPTNNNRRKQDAHTPLGTPECYSHVEFETPKVKGAERWSGLSDEHLIGLVDGFSVTVAVRVRPFTEREKNQKDVKCAVFMDGNETTILSKYGQRTSFCYDFCFWSFDKVKGQFDGQETVYERLGRPLLDNAFEGYNTCLFAYGQTGSGKSYTIMGFNKETGIIPRFCRELFRRVDEQGHEERAKYTIEISFFEIYNEKIHDLLASSINHDKDIGKKRPTLRVREHPVLGPYVEGLSTFVANSFGDIHSWIELGNKQRATAATGMNDKSSRSHSVFTIVMTKTKAELIEGDEHTHNVTSRINLVDLAGSERCNVAQTSGDRLKEGANINRSLMTLSKVISQLADNSSKRKKFFIPYRDSVLTWLLKESLGGNSKTAMIATISPSSQHVEETLSTLRYAKQARSIINLAKVNEDPKARLVRELRSEIERLRGQGFTTPTRAPYPAPDTATDTHTEAIKESLTEIADLRRQLTLAERQIEETEGSWKERLEESETRRVREISEMEKAGVAFKFDNTLPNLVNLNEDPQLSEVLLYVLGEGQTRLGKMTEHSGHQIQLGGALVADSHCLIANKEGDVTVKPVGEAQTFVNGQLISETHALKHGDRLVVGDHYFRFNHPQQVKDRSKMSDNSVGVVDFEFARNELVAAQSARLEAEVEEERLRNHQEKIEGIQRAQETAQKELDRQKQKYETKIQQLCVQLEEQIEERESVSYNQQNSEKQIQELQLENRILEGQVSSTRHRLELEMKAAQRGLEETKVYQSHIFKELELEKEKAEREMEKMRKAKMKREKDRGRGAKEMAKNKRSLLKLSVWLQEANNISKKLGKHTMFNRHDVTSYNGGSTLDDFQSSVHIRVTNGRLGIVTKWTLAKFEDKLIQMRELFKAAEEGREQSDDDVFYDPEDDWNKDYKIDSPVTPLGRCFNGSCTPNRWGSSTSSTGSSLGHGSMTSLESLQGKSDSLSSTGLPSLCRAILKSSLNDTSLPNSRKETIADRVLGAMQRVKDAARGLQEACAPTGNENATECGDSFGHANINQFLVQITSAIQVLTNLIAAWDSNYQHQAETPVVLSCRELSEQMVDTCRKTAGHVMKLLQGCEGDICAMVTDANTQIAQCLVFLSRLVGEIAITTNIEVLMFTDFDNRQENNMVNSELKQGFLNGADVFIDKTLQQGLRSVIGYEAELQVTLGPDNSLNQIADSTLQHCLTLTTSAKILLSKCQDIQFELASVLDGRDKRPDSAYSHSYQRARQLVSLARSLADDVCTVNGLTRPLGNGKDIDWPEVILTVDALLQTTPTLSATATSSGLLPTPTCSDCSYASVESSASSDTLACRPNHLVVLAGQQLMQSLQTFRQYLESCGVRPSPYGI